MKNIFLGVAPTQILRIADSVRKYLYNKNEIAEALSDVAIKKMESAIFDLESVGKGKVRDFKFVVGSAISLLKDAGIELEIAVNKSKLNSINSIKLVWRELICYLLIARCYQLTGERYLFNNYIEKAANVYQKIQKFSKISKILIKATKAGHYGLRGGVSPGIESLVMAATVGSLVTISGPIGVVGMLGAIGFSAFSGWSVIKASMFGSSQAESYWKIPIQSNTISSLTFDSDGEILEITDVIGDELEKISDKEKEWKEKQQKENPFQLPDGGWSGL